MSKRQAAPRRDVKETIRLLLASGEAVSAGAAAEAAGVTRQAAHYHLSRMLEAGEVRRLGAGRSSRYVPLFVFRATWPLGSSREDEIWKEITDSLPDLALLEQNVRSILNYALTEMVNNAIEHSRGTHVEVTVRRIDDRLAVDVVDDGVGVFDNVREKWGLEDNFAAIQELAKGKRTTAPEAHTGEGIFFTSKAVDRFELESAGLRWVVDSGMGDQAVGQAPPRAGTRVTFEIDPASRRTPADVFGEFTDAETLKFDRSRIAVRLYETSDRFVSRSEAKRVATKLERFREVVLDFSGVEEVGQGFVDELFRVWARDHPETHLVPTNMNPVVERMVRRGLV